MLDKAPFNRMPRPLASPDSGAATSEARILALALRLPGVRGAALGRLDGARVGDWLTAGDWPADVAMGLPGAAGTSACPHGLTTERLGEPGRPASGVLAVHGATLAPGDRQALAELAALTTTLWQAEAQRAADRAACLAEFEALKDAFVGVVSHELRTPISALVGALALLADGTMGDMPDGASRMVAIADASARRLAGLIEAILEVDRMSAGRLTLQREVLAVEALFAALAEAHGEAAECAGVRLEFEPGRTPPLYGDRDHLLRMVGHLVTNAIAFSPPGGRIRLSAEGAGTRVCLSVRDQGPGVPAAVRESIFERFRLGDPSDARTHNGVGLGLVGSSRVDLQACKLEYSIVSPK